MRAVKSPLNGPGQTDILLISPPLGTNALNPGYGPVLNPRLNQLTGA